MQILSSAQRLALPFRRLALGGVQLGVRHLDLDRSERACQRLHLAGGGRAQRSPFLDYWSSGFARNADMPAQH